MEMIEPAHIQDVFASGLGRIDKLSGGMIRLVFYVEEVGPEGIERHVVAKIIRHRSSLGHSLKAIATAVSEEPLVADKGEIFPLN
jgi:hypothetical protein